MKTKTLIEKQLKRKGNQELVDTIIAAKKQKAWVEVAGLLAAPRKNYPNMNLDKINKDSKEGESVLIPGKVLSQGNIDKKLKVVALAFSETAKEKLKNSGCQVSSITEEIKSNPEAKGLKILK
jgi:large subunit ribosomal protein L18e